MRAFTAFLVGVGTVTVAIAGGLGGGLLIADAMNPKAKAGADIGQFRRSDSLPTFKPLTHVGASLAFIDPAVDGSARAGAAQAHSAAATPAAPAPVQSAAAAAPGDQDQIKTQTAKQDATATPAEPKEAKASATTQSASSPPQAPNAAQGSNPADAYARAHDADVKKSAAEKRRAARAQRWADRHRRDQRDQDQANSDQQLGDNDGARGDDGPRGSRYGDRSDGGRSYSDSYARRYDNRPRYRDADRYYWGQDEWRNRDAPRAFDLPEMQLLAPE